eukprot:1965257-Pleurochrysis_carterae.AAC.3
MSSRQLAEISNPRNSCPCRSLSLPGLVWVPSVCRSCDEGRSKEELIKVIPEMATWGGVDDVSQARVQGGGKPELPVP